MSEKLQKLHENGLQKLSKITNNNKLKVSATSTRTTTPSSSVNIPTTRQTTLDKNNNKNIVVPAAANVNDINNSDIPLVLRKQGNSTNCSDTFIDSNCPCSGLEVPQQKRSGIIKPINYTDKRSLIPLERLNELRKRVHEAIKYHKVFTIRGCFYTIRKALVQRGWVEKLDIHRRTFHTLPSNFMIEDLVQQLPLRQPGESRRKHISKCERNVMSRLLEYIAVDFLWTCRKEKSDWIDLARNPTLVINKVNKVPYTSKEGLCQTLRDFHWFYEEGTAETYFPRCFNVWNPEELNDFIDNFRLTACIGTLRWLVETFKEKGINEITSTLGKVPISSIHFAINRCNEYISYCLHYDIDNSDNEIIKIWEHDWDVFLTHHFILTHENAKILVNENNIIDTVLILAEKILHEMKIYWPQYNIDGKLNVWIVKPGNRCRGRGIQVMNNIKQIIALVNPQIVTKTRYVIQKYIERPLIIHNTKFDIRQWFMVTNVQPLVIWMYKESYLRFSSQEYNLMNYHESVHLTNHAVQKKYTNAVRDERLPNENMWDCHTFQAYLRQIGKFQMWKERIYPGMQKAIIGTILASQDNMDRRPNNFELFGADFMICEDFYPWLIEINSSPDLGATTSVTARLCPQCLEDTVKVVIDRRTNPGADTGSFELIYKQIIPPAPAYMGLNLFLKGQQILPKGNGKKDKYKEEQYIRAISAKPNHHHHSIYHLSKGSMRIQQQQTSTGGPIIVDFMETLNQRSKSGIEIGQHKKTTTSVCSGSGSSAMVLKKHNFPATNINKVQSNKFLTTQSSIFRRSANKLNDTFEKNLKTNYLKRHASCGPKYSIITSSSTTITTPSSSTTTTTTTTTNQKPSNDEILLVSPKEIDSLTSQTSSKSIIVKKEFECVGSKCLENTTNPDWTGQVQQDSTTTVQLNSLNSSTSSRKQSLENIHRSKSGQLRSVRKTQNTHKLLSGNLNLRKIVTNSNSNSNSNSGNDNDKGNDNKLITVKNLKNTNTNNNNYNSNIFAVGMNLRAWRAKYNKILKNQKENIQIPVARSCLPLTKK